VHEVEGVRRQTGVPGVGGHHLDVGQPVLADVLVSQRGVHRVGVQPDHPPARRYRVRQQVTSAGTMG